MYRTVRGFADMMGDLHAMPADDLRGAAPARRTLHELGLQ